MISALILSQSCLAQESKKQQSAPDTSICLELIGKFDGTVKDFEGNYTAKLIRDNKVTEEQTLGVKKSFTFEMRRNMLYTIKIEKKGYISKMISISTKIPKKTEAGESFNFDLQTNLISEELSGHFNDDDLDFPVALVSYGKKCDCFEYNLNYTVSLISRMINSLIFGD